MVLAFIVDLKIDVFAGNMFTTELLCNFDNKDRIKKK